MSPPSEKPPAAAPPTGAEGVLIRAENGDVVTFDATGLTLRLSDTVIADLRRRLARPALSAAELAARLGDIDAWAPRLEGDWLHFTARLERDRPPRDYQKPLAGGDIIACAPGPLTAILGLGGPRRAGFTDGPVAFPFHILAPADHIGAVGLEGTARAEPVAGLQRLPHATREALIAETLLFWRHDALCGLPLFLTRAETDASASIAAFAEGAAWGNFLAALDSLVAAAAALQKPARVLAVGLDYGVEDITSDPAALALGLRRLMVQIESALAARGLSRPIFLITAEAGTHHLTSPAALQAHGQLAWAPGPHRLAVSAPGYMFEQTEFGRPTDAARARMAEMDAHALVALAARAPWTCPLPLLAETAGADLRVTCQAMADLVLDDAFGAGPACGFALGDGAGPIAITAVRIAPDDSRSLLLRTTRPPGPGAQLGYAANAPAAATDAFPANRGALRDSWAAASRHGGAPLHRWALPCLLPVHRGGPA